MGLRREPRAGLSSYNVRLRFGVGRYPLHEVMDECHVPMLSYLLVSRQDCPSITIIYNEAHYLPASKHLTLTICSELQSDWKNQDQFALQNDCQIHFHLWRPFGKGKDGDWDGKKDDVHYPELYKLTDAILTCLPFYQVLVPRNFHSMQVK
ncbi:hypothetical protein WISP_27821 [Willisornis vidua]|uniref:Uncharacterized protein n=1 Tax=Willisornis vidua TaxID=1566151 RepID=A0ABQ9DRG6_9PASS|nr:hypothetical protein WISP_27821 [Willisornis vidua]